MDDEPLDIIDEENDVITQEMKSVAHRDGLRHRVSAVFVQKEDGRYLIPTAAASKVEAGGLYHSAAGHIPAGETYLQAAKRELFEETGLAADENDFEYLGAYWFEKDYATRKERERFEVYSVRYAPRMGEVVLNDEQINPQWLSEDELRGIYANEPQRFSAPLKMTCENILNFRA